MTVNLQTGSATGDMSVGTDVILGGVTAVRGSSFNDSITGRSDNGSNSENFDGWGGDNSIDGNGGFDRVRYDGQTIAGPIGILVNLAAGTVTGATRPRPRWSAAIRCAASSRCAAAMPTTSSTRPASRNATTVRTPMPAATRATSTNSRAWPATTRSPATAIPASSTTARQAGIVVTVGGFTVGGNPGGGLQRHRDRRCLGRHRHLRGVNQIRGSIFNDTFTGFDNSATGFIEQFEGWAGDDSIDGGPRHRPRPL